MLVCARVWPWHPPHRHRPGRPRHLPAVRPAVRPAAYAEAIRRNIIADYRIYIPLVQELTTDRADLDVDIRDLPADTTAVVQCMYLIACMLQTDRCTQVRGRAASRAGDSSRPPARAFSISWKWSATAATTVAAARASGADVSAARPVDGRADKGIGCARAHSSRRPGAKLCAGPRFSTPPSAVAAASRKAKWARGGTALARSRPRHRRDHCSGDVIARAEITDGLAQKSLKNALHRPNVVGAPCALSAVSLCALHPRALTP